MYLTRDQADNKDFVVNLAEQTLDKPVTSLERLPGQMAYNYMANHRYIVKFPSEKTNPDDWLRQSQYMPVLQDKLSFQIPIPKISTVQDAQKKTLVSSWYEKIDGVCISNTFEFSQKDIKFKDVFFEQLSDAAHQIHRVQPKELPFELPTKQEILEKYFFKKIAPNPTYHQKKNFRKLLHNPVLGLGKSAEKTSVLTHSDLHCGNVILNDKNQLVGILDFDTFGRGDYFWEFRPLLYEDPSDISLFQKKYTQRTGIQIDSRDSENIRQFKTTLEWLAVLYTLSRAFLPKEEHNFLKKEIQKRQRSKYLFDKQKDK